MFLSQLIILSECVANYISESLLSSLKNITAGVQIAFHIWLFACLVSLDGAGGRHEDAGGESEVTETLQHQVEAGGQPGQLGGQKLEQFYKLVWHWGCQTGTDLESDLETDDKGTQEEEKVRETEKYQ